MSDQAPAFVLSAHVLPVHSLPQMPVRSSDAHKGMFGHGLLVGGSRGMLGAILLAGEACLRSGAGLTTLAVPESAQMGLGIALPSVMSLGLPDLDPPSLGISSESSFPSRWYELLTQPRYQQATLAIGPGLGRAQHTDRLARHSWQAWGNAAVFDADALNALADAQSSTSDPLNLADHVSPRVVTPHPGEWERLTGVSRKDRAAQIAKARALADQWNVVIVLKGANTFVTNGRSEFVNATGNPSMAVGGSGDCLTGVITALLCQGFSPLEAAILGVHLHGLAGDLAHEQLGAPSTLPTDLISYIPSAFRSLANQTRN